MLWRRLKKARDRFRSFVLKIWQERHLAVPKAKEWCAAAGPALRERCVKLAPQLPLLWQRWRFLAYGAIGWAMIYANYPFGWQMPKYAEF